MLAWGFPVPSPIEPGMPSRPSTLRFTGLLAALVGAMVMLGALTALAYLSDALVDNAHPYIPALRDAHARAEKAILLAMADGLTNGEIGSKFYLTESTVKTHVGRVLAKLHLRDRVHAVIFAYDNGLVDR